MYQNSYGLTVNNYKISKGLGKDQVKKKLKIVAVSDTHGQDYNLKALKSQSGDIFIMAGDFTYYGQDNDYKNFIQFLDDLKHFKHKIVIAGNHEIILDRNFNLDWYDQADFVKQYKGKYSRQYLIQQIKKRAIYLEHQYVEVQGLKIFGSPYTPYYCGTAFQVKQPQLQLLANHIPKDLDILITHGPPLEILDKTRKNLHAGSQSLLKRVKQIKPKVHIFGHIHEGRTKFGQLPFIKKYSTKFYNVAHRPTLIEIDQEEK